MTPVLQGFTGHVPAAIARRPPDANLHRINWIEWQTCLLDPLDPLFAKVAGLFMEEQTKRFGTDHLYAADTFIEMTPPSGEEKYLGELSRAIYDGMAKTDPDAVWVLQGWTFYNQRRFWSQPRIAAFLGAIPDERMVVLDLFCETDPMWNRTAAFCGKPWLWCNVQNFGCNVHLTGALNTINEDLPAVRRDPEAGRLAGLGFVNEGLDYNPVVHDLMFEMAWRTEPVDLDQWIGQYALHRYGRLNDDARQAWRILLATVYSGTHRFRSKIVEAPHVGGGGGSPGYDPIQLAEAWGLLVASADELGGCDTFRFDLVNVARQVLSIHAARLHGDLTSAYRAKDARAFDRASAGFGQLIRDMDDLLATRREFLLGRWLEDAKRWGTTPAERNRFEWNARRVLTLWGEGPHIDDYAWKEWSGLLNGYYLKRWERFAQALAESLRNDQPFDGNPFNRALRQWMVDWSDQRTSYPTEPRGDSVAVARKLWKKYAKAVTPLPAAISLTTGKPVACSFSLGPYPPHLANDGRKADTDRYWATDVTRDKDAWWQVDLEEPVEVSRVVVVGYYGDERFYDFAVETSLDGQEWKMAADRRNNKEPSTADGYTCSFEPRSVRYIRVTMTANSANTGRHLIEVMAFRGGTETRSGDAAEINDPEIVSIEPEIDGAAIAEPKNKPDLKKTLASLKEVDGLYVMTFYGDYTRMVDYFHERVLMSAVVGTIVKRQYCSLFSYFGDRENPLFGRNFDNVDTHLLVCYYFPENGYASIAFTPMKELGVGGKTKLNMDSSFQKMKLANCPCMSIEGMNEKGLCLALASIEPVKYEPEENKESRWLIRLMREILDHAANVDEAARIARSYNVFDNGLNLLSHHILVADQEGRSAVLEHDGVEMRVIPMDGAWQAATNRKLFDVSAERTRKNCARFRTATDILKTSGDSMSWKGGMSLLDRVAQHDVDYVIRGEKITVNTEWSAIFNMKKREVYISLDMNYDKVFKLVLRDRDDYTRKAE